MENQVANLKKKSIRCDYLSSTRTAQERASILQDIKSAAPSIRLLFITPELLSTEGFMGTLKAMSSKGKLTLFAVDEAHCISSWFVDCTRTQCFVRSALILGAVWHGKSFMVLSSMLLQMCPTLSSTCQLCMLLHTLCRDLCKAKPPSHGQSGCRLRG